MLNSENNTIDCKCNKNINKLILSVCWTTTQASFYLSNTIFTEKDVFAKI